MYHDLNNKMLKSLVIHVRYESGGDFAEKIRVSGLCNFFAKIVTLITCMNHQREHFFCVYLHLSFDKLIN